MKNIKKQNKLIMVWCMIFITLACGFAETLPKPAPLEGNFNCNIPIVLQTGDNNIVALSFTITPDQEIGNWSIFDLGTRSVSFGSGIGESSIDGNKVAFSLTSPSTSPSGKKITYKINGTIESNNKMTGEYNFDYGNRYGVATGKFDCDPTPPTAEPTDNSGTSSTSTPTQLPAKTPTIALSSNSPSAIFLSNKPVGTCKWDVSISLSGFAPNSKITVSSIYEELVCASGNSVSDSWSDTYPQITDKNGNLTILYLHEGTGDYTYTFIDNVGNKASVSFTTSP